MKVGCAVHALFDVGSYIDYFVSGEEDRSPYMYDNTVKSLQYQVLSTREKASASLRKAFPRGSLFSENLGLLRRFLTLWHCSLAGEACLAPTKPHRGCRPAKFLSTL